MQRPEDIPLENLSRSSTPVMGGKPIPIALSNISANSGIQLRNSPKKNNSFDGGISVSSSPSTSILGNSIGQGGFSGGGSPVMRDSSMAAVKLAVVSQETSFMGGPEEAEEQPQLKAEEDEQPNQSRRKGTIETV